MHNAALQTFPLKLRKIKVKFLVNIRSTAPNFPKSGGSGPRACAIWGRRWKRGPGGPPNWSDERLLCGFPLWEFNGANTHTRRTYWDKRAHPSLPVRFHIDHPLAMSPVDFQHGQSSAERPAWMPPMPLGQTKEDQLGPARPILRTLKSPHEDVRVEGGLQARTGPDASWPDSQRPTSIMGQAPIKD